MGDLLPCPFCGSTEAHSVGDAIMCDGCEAMGPDGHTPDEARDRWNTRATPKPKRDPLTDSIPSATPIHGITVMLNQYMEPGEMMLVCGSAAFARLKAEVSNG